MKWLARQFRYTKDLEVVNDQQEARISTLEDYILVVDDMINELSDLLPGDPTGNSIDTLTAFNDAVTDISTLMAACIDYRNLLIRADVPDIVSGRNKGVEAIMAKYGIRLDVRKSGVGNVFALTNQNMMEAIEQEHREQNANND